MFGSINQYSLRPTSSRTTVPNNDLARIMYYLSCVFSAIDYKDQDVQRYRNYHNWSLLTEDEQRLVLVLALTLSPDEFDGKVFFHSDELCGDSSNKFYEFSEVRNQVLAVQSIVIAGQTRNVKKIMTYRMSWMINNYFEPVKRFAAYLEQQRAQKMAAERARSARFYSGHQNPSSQGCTIS